VISLSDLVSKLKDLLPVSNSSNANISSAATNDHRLREMRLQQQERLNRVSQIARESKSNNPNVKPKLKKLSAKDKKIKNSAAYKFSTTGDWGGTNGNASTKNDDRRYSGLGSSGRSSYRPPNPFQRYGRRPGGGGG
jgi:hypothetical protein